MVYYSSNWRARRSVLFMPASNQKALAKASTFDCDGLIFDLEDSVARDALDEARQNLLTLVKGQNFGGREVIIRVSSPDSEDYSQDISVAIDCAPDVILVPKVEAPGVLNDLSQMLDYSHATDICLWAMIETPMALVNLKELAACGGKLECLVVGPNDLARETGVNMAPGRAAMVPWLMDIVAHGRANGLAVLDGVYNHFKDLDGLSEECEQGVAMGFDGKTLIHPAQIAVANQVFSPSDTAVERARNIVELFSLPANKGKNALQLDGEMVEALHFGSAKNLLALVARLKR